MSWAKLKHKSVNSGAKYVERRLDNHEEVWAECNLCDRINEEAIIPHPHAYEG